jgi:hypothetical protein
MSLGSLPRVRLAFGELCAPGLQTLGMVTTKAVEKKLTCWPLLHNTCSSFALEHPPTTFLPTVTCNTKQLQVQPRSCTTQLDCHSNRSAIVCSTPGPQPAAAAAAAAAAIASLAVRVLLLFPPLLHHQQLSCLLLPLLLPARGHLLTARHPTPPTHTPAAGAGAAAAPSSVSVICHHRHCRPPALLVGPPCQVAHRPTAP